ncbi:methylglyoxal synthase [Oceanomicrobium pacificus]|uniref:Methylglyoxal synthase n=1 Tax=Oceanomicrobium pacificus TaxID=2692916 RepID=A0A6B0TMQ4_9RHOB|nr:methylglyoxal synthase [Oceanomicrobium pacificus]MXU65807.1 methylglyoxal synthase [Oceanomicrobium pacificus]
MTRQLTIGLVAHDARKDGLVDWAKTHAALLAPARIISTGTTGGRLLEALPDLDVTRVKSGPLGGDQQIGAMIAEDRMDALIFFVDPLSPMPHDVDVKALMRLGIVYDLPMAFSARAATILLKGLEAPGGG